MVKWPVSGTNNRHSFIPPGILISKTHQGFKIASSVTAEGRRDQYCQVNHDPPWDELLQDGADPEPVPIKYTTAVLGGLRSKRGPRE